MDYSVKIRGDSQILGTLYVGFGTSGTSKVPKLFFDKILLFALLYYTRNLLGRCNYSIVS